jgi:hypothetical protein
VDPAALASFSSHPIPSMPSSEEPAALSAGPQPEI